MQDVKRILAPVDFSPVSDRVIAEALSLASAEDARVDIIHVCPPLGGVHIPAPKFGMEHGWVGGDMHGLERVTSVQRRLNDLLQRMPQTNADVHATIDYGAPADVIIERSKAQDIVVVGKKTKTMSLVDDVADAVAKDAACPVLIVHEDPAERPVSKRFLETWDLGAAPEPRYKDQVLYALFEDLRTATDAIERAMAAQIPLDDVNLMMTRETEAKLVDVSQHDTVTRGLAGGMAVGTAAGTFLGGLSSMTVTVGGIAASLLGPIALLGGATSLLTALVAWGVKEGDERRIQDAVADGGVLLALHVSDPHVLSAAAAVLRNAEGDAIEIVHKKGLS